MGYFNGTDGFGGPSLTNGDKIKDCDKIEYINLAKLIDMLNFSFCFNEGSLTLFFLMKKTFEPNFDIFEYNEYVGEMFAELIVLIDMLNVLRKPFIPLCGRGSQYDNTFECRELAQAILNLK